MRFAIITWIWFFLFGLKVNSQNIGIGTFTPQSKLQLKEGDIYLEEIGKGVIIKSPDGNCWRLKVSNTGIGNFESVSCPDEGIINYGGQNYKTKLMPDGKWWMIENLNIGTMVNGITTMTNNGIIEKYCYNNDVANCTTYGGLYQWDEMMQYTTTEGAQGICPTGWHLPTTLEWVTLETYLPNLDKGSRIAGNEVLWTDGTLDQSTYFGTSGFVALPAGYRYSDGTFYGQRNYAYFRSSTQGGTDNAWYSYLSYDNSILGQILDVKIYGYSVRCVQD